MSDITSDKIELVEHKTHNKVLVVVVGGLFLLLNGILTISINSTASEMRETNRNLVAATAAMQVMQAQQGYTQEQVKALQKNKEDADKVHKDIDARLDAVEKSIALHNQWIEAHNRP